MELNNTPHKTLKTLIWHAIKKIVPKNRFTWTVYDKLRALQGRLQTGLHNQPPARPAPSFEEIRAIWESIPADIIGGSPLDKCYIMAYLATRLGLRSFVEIGVYRGKSLFSVAPAFLANGGGCYGIDPCSSENLKENELPDQLKSLVDNFADTTDLQEIYQEVVGRRQDLGMQNSVILLQKTAEQAYAFFQEVGLVRQESQFPRSDAFIDMLHIDGNHDYALVQTDAQLYIPLVRQGGIIVFDDVGWSGVRRVYDRAKEHFVVLYEDQDFAILYNDPSMVREMREQPHPLPSWAQVRLLQSSLPAIMENVRFTQALGKQEHKLSIFAAIMTYNSADYIEQCIRSILMQEGDFEAEIGVFDDVSTDDTLERVRALIPELPEHIHLTIHANAQNGGYAKNYLRVFDAMRNSDADFLTCIDGDDYLCSPARFQRNMDELIRRPECALSFNRLKFYFQKENKFQLWGDQDALQTSTYTALDLARIYFIGNGSCSTIRRNAACAVPAELYTQAGIGDWLTHLMYATKGDIAYIKEPMNVYRKHSQGVWSGASLSQKEKILFQSISRFNQLTDYLFYEQLYNTQAAVFSSKEAIDDRDWDVTIIDDVFPHPGSSFRMEEYVAYLCHFENLRIFCNGESTIALGNRSHADILAAFKQEHRELAPRLFETLHPCTLPMKRELHTRLAYFCFLGNIYSSLDTIQRCHIPFIFELYPGGSFQLNNAKSDAMLRKVMQSAYFRKVIVTQDVTKMYLLQKKMCTEEQIVEIFGVVTPARLLNATPRLPTGGDGDPLKVCFAAFRYTAAGKDKGYDVFVAAVRKLSKRYNNIEFHVAGTFDETVLPLGKAAERITFHGILDGDTLAAFFQQMDIIVSPNMNDRISQGSFDGFPTATCTEAGLNGALILCTDPLGLNGGRFQNRYEIEIIEHDVNAIVERIVYYYHHREALRAIISQQVARIQKLYATEVQIDERIRVIETELNCCFRNNEHVQ